MNRRDAEAAAAITTYRVNQLARIRSQAEKWIPGLAAVVGVLTTALVIKGPDSLTDLPEETQYVVFGAMVIGALLIGGGTWASYKAAHGDPTKENALDSLVKRFTAGDANIQGIANQWDSALLAVYNDTRDSLKRASYLTLGGTLVLALSLGYALFAPSGADDSSPRTCIEVDDERVELKGAMPEVSSGSLVVVPCDDE